MASFNVVERTQDKLVPVSTYLMAVMNSYSLTKLSFFFLPSYYILYSTVSGN